MQNNKQQQDQLKNTATTSQERKSSATLIQPTSIATNPKRSSIQRQLIYTTSPHGEHQYASISQISPNLAQSIIAQQAKPLRPRAHLRRLNAIAIQQQHQQHQDKNNATIPPRRPSQHPASYSPTSGGISSGGGNTGGGNRYLAGNQAPIVGAMSAKLDTGSNNLDNNRYAWAARMAKARPSVAPQAAIWPRSDVVTAESGSAATQDSQSTKFQYHFTSPFSSAASRVLVVNPMQIVNLSEHTKSRVVKIIEALKRFSEKWFSHVLLLMFLAIYACLGAYVFISFEANTEQLEKQNIIDTRESIVNETWNQAQLRNQENFNEFLISKLEDYERLLSRAYSSGMTSSSLENQWTFWGALFYSMTVFTTIGYGHLTPITFAGRVATMIYAIFGIPILLMVLADLGKLLTRIIKFAFKQFRNLYNKCMNRKSSIRTRKMISDNTSQYIGVARDAIEGLSTRVLTRAGTFRDNATNFKRMRMGLNSRGKTILVTEEYPQQRLDIDAAAAQLSLELANGPEMVASDVIVTPVNQSKPVSPIVENPPQISSKTFAKSAHYNKHLPIKAGSGKHNRKTSTTSSSSSTKAKAVSMGTSKMPKLISRSSSISSSHIVQINPNNESSDKLVPCGKNDDSTDGKVPKQEPEAQVDIGDKQQQEPLQSPGNGVDINEEEESYDDDQDEEEVLEDEEDELEEDLDIPVSFALFLLVTYMMFGAVVFSIWEGWNFFDSLYFVFISMSTIGFGDLVPQHPKRMIGTFIYLLFGLALTSMCINVVQERIHSTFLRAKMQIGEKMGLDLDQIMADDYYHDDPGMLDDQVECELYAEPVTVADSVISESQSGSAIALGTCEPDPTISKTKKQITNTGNETGSGAPKVLKTQNSIKSSGGNKKKSTASLPGHGNQSSSTSLWRKSSKKSLRNSSPRPTEKVQVNPPTNVIPATPTPTPSPNPTDQTNPLIGAIPSKTNVQSAQAKEFESEPVNNESSGQHHVKKHEVVDIREASVSKPALVSSQSQPNVPGSQALTSTIDSNQSKRTYESLIKSHPSSSLSSRRASVSLELNQLDEVIMDLWSPSSAGRYGPLLGIPSRGGSVTNSISPTPPPMSTNRRAYSTISRATRNPTSGRNSTSPRTLNESQPPRPHTRASFCNPSSHMSPTSAQFFRSSFTNIRTGSPYRTPSRNSMRNKDNVKRDPKAILDEAIKAIQSSVM